MNVHVGKAFKEEFRGLYNIPQTPRKLLSEESTKTLMHAFVTAIAARCCMAF